MNRKPFVVLLTLAFLVIGLSACTIEVARNADGSLAVETTMPEASFESELALALENTNLQNLDVDLQDGFITVSGERPREHSGEIDTLTFRIDLGVSEGQLTATISDVQVNGEPVEGDPVERWNERIAARIARAVQRRPNSELQLVSVGGDVVTMSWRVETARSRGD